MTSSEQDTHTLLTHSFSWQYYVVEVWWQLVETVCVGGKIVRKAATPLSDDGNYGQKNKQLRATTWLPGVVFPPRGGSTWCHFDSVAESWFPSLLCLNSTRVSSALPDMSNNNLNTIFERKTITISHVFYLNHWISTWCARATRP